MVIAKIVVNMIGYCRLRRWWTKSSISPRTPSTSTEASLSAGSSTSSITISPPISNTSTSTISITISPISRRASSSAKHEKGSDCHNDMEMQAGGEKGDFKTPQECETALKNSLLSFWLVLSYFLLPIRCSFFWSKRSLKAPLTQPYDHGGKLKFNQVIVNLLGPGSCNLGQCIAIFHPITHGKPFGSFPKIDPFL